MLGHIYKADQVTQPNKSHFNMNRQHILLRYAAKNVHGVSPPPPPIIFQYTKEETNELNEVNRNKLCPTDSFASEVEKKK